MYIRNIFLFITIIAIVRMKTTAISMSTQEYERALYLLGLYETFYSLGFIQNA